MKKIKIIALALACIFLFTGCSLVSVDKERVANQVVAIVNGEEIYRYEVDDWVDDMYAMYGLSSDPQDEEELAQFEEISNGILDMFVTNEVLLQKASDLGIMLTDEEKQQFEEDAETYFDEKKQSIQEEVEQDAEADSSIDIEAETELRYTEFLESNSMDTYIENLGETELRSKTQQYVYDQRELTEEEVRTWYDEMLSIQQGTEDFATQYITNIQQGYINTYVPEGIIAVKHVLLKFEDEDLVSEAQTLYSEGNKDEALELLQDETDALMPTALEVQQRLQDGESIDDLIVELGEDDGMVDNETGYLVTEGISTYLEEFTEAALALTNVGDISDPVTTYYGLHVLQNIKVYESGVVPFEELKEQIETSLLAAEQQITYDETVEKWTEEADIIYYRDRLINGL